MRYISTFSSGKEREGTPVGTNHGHVPFARRVCLFICVTISISFFLSLDGIVPRHTWDEEAKSEKKKIRNEGGKATHRRVGGCDLFLSSATNRSG